MDQPGLRQSTLMKLNLKEGVGTATDEGVSFLQSTPHPQFRPLAHIFKMQDRSLS